MLSSNVLMLQLAGIRKRFGGVTALRDGSLTARPGEVHLLLGENGAGKSTLMKIVAGMIARDGGSFQWLGQPAHFRSPSDARAAGIAMVHQESLLAPHLTVAENIWLGSEPRREFGFVDRRAMRERARRLIEEHAFPLNPDLPVAALSPAGRQLVEICRAIACDAKLLIFDEPTSSLSGSETGEVLRLVAALRERGAAVIYITHRMEELRELGDRATVLRDGETVYSSEMAETSTAELIRHMVGRPVETIYQRDPIEPGAVLLRAEKLSRHGVLHDVSFTLRAGEIVGLAGLIGAGRTELCRALFGVDHPDSGSLEIEGRIVRIRSPRDADRAGVALIPEDRGRTGLATGLSVGHNMSLASLPRFSPGGFIRSSQETDAHASQITRLRLRCDSPRQLVRKLSGGNQQKVVISKWVLADSRIFLFDEPTRGIDIGAKIEVFQLMDELARRGCAVLMVSSELTELLQVADRILVMRAGRITAELPSPTTQEEILRYAALG